MRDDEDNIRQYLPVLRRIIILVAVLTAIPVVMWTITAFVRSHIGPPRAPDLRPMAIAPANPPTNTTVAAIPDQAPAQSVHAAQAVPPSASADGGAKDGGVAAPADATPAGVTPTIKTASVAPANAAQDSATPRTSPSASAYSADNAAASPADAAAPDQSSDGNGAAVAAHPQDSVWPAPPTAAASADALPAGEAITGPVPLPRKRPTSFAMAGNVPLPAPRPEAAGAGVADSPPTVTDWLKKVFHSPAPASSPDGGSDTAHE